MDKGKIIPFDIKRKYKSYDELLEEDYCNVGGIVAPLFDAIYVDKYNNTIGKTKSGKEFLIPKKKNRPHSPLPKIECDLTGKYPQVNTHIKRL